MYWHEQARKGRSRGQEGFTLMELLVVVSIVGILAIAFGASFLGWRERYEAESDIKSIHGAIVDARVMAISQKRIFFVNIPAVASGTDHVVRVYKDINPDLDPADQNRVAGDGVLEVGVDPQHGPDLVLKNRIDMEDRYRHFWFDGSGHIRYEGIDQVRPGRRDFQIRLMQWDSDISAQSDYNCLRITPPLYIAGGLWNATEGQEEADGSLHDVRLAYNPTVKALTTPGKPFPLCSVK